METTSRASQADCSCFISSSPKENVADSSSKEKKILPGRRQQRHSTEIGSEYHRWWVVRNALGFETNEHIAGLLLDGFHGLLQQLVAMCGGEIYQPNHHGRSRAPSDPGDGTDDLAPAPSPSSSTSPPGVIEDMEEFMEYKNAITHYCDSLWRLCGQHDRRLHELDNTSQPVQEFLMRLLGYLRAAKGKSYSLNHKKKRFKSNTVSVRKCGDGNPPESSTSSFCSQIPSATPQNQMVNPASTSSLTLLPSQDSTGLFLPSQQQWDNKEFESRQRCSDTAGFSAGVGEMAFKGIPFMDSSGQVSTDCAQTTRKSGLETEGVMEAANRTFQSEIIMSTSQSIQPMKQTVCRANLNEITANPNMSRCDQTPTEKQYQGSECSPTQHSSSSQLCLVNNQQDPDSQSGGTPACPKQQAPAVARECSSRQWRSTLQEKLDNPPQCRHLEHHPSCYNNQKVCNLDYHQSLKQQLKNKKDHLSPWETSSTQEVPEYNQMAADNKQMLGRNEMNVYDRENSNTVNQSSITLGLHECCSSGDSEMENLNEEKLRSLLKMKPLPLSPYMDSYTENSGDGSSFFQPELVEKKTSYRRHGLALPQGVVASSEKKACDGDVSLATSAGCPETSVLSVSRSQPVMESSNVFKGKSTDIISPSTNSSFYTDIRNRKHASNVGELKSQKTCGREMLQPIQPALYPSTDKPPLPINAPLGTPVIFYPANSFPVNDNSLASLSSLVQNIVYNSHGTILKPLSLPPGTAKCPVTNYGISQQLMSQPPVLASEGLSHRRPIAASLPVLSEQLNKSKPTLLPFYISQTAVNTPINLPKCTSSVSASRVNPLQTPSAFQPYPAYQQPPPPVPSNHQGFSSTRLYQEWNSGTVKQTQTSDVTNSMNQLKISDVRSCTDTDFSNFGREKNEKVQDFVTSSTSNQMTEVTNNEQNSINLPQILASGESTSDKNYLDVGSQQSDLSSKTSANKKAAISSSYHTCNHTGLSRPFLNTQSPTVPLSESQNQVPCVDVADQLSSHSNLHYELALTHSKNSKKILTSLLSSKLVTPQEDGLYPCNQTKGSPITIEAAEKQSSVDSATEGGTTIQADSLHKDVSVKREVQSDRMGKGVLDKCSSKQSPLSSASSSLTSSRSRRLLCTVCNLLFFSGTDLLVHRYEQHSYVCGECDGRFLSAARLKQHKESDHPSIMLCTQCRFHTFSREALHEHLWSEHNIDPNSKTKETVDMPVKAPEKEHKCDNSHPDSAKGISSYEIAKSVPSEGVNTILSSYNKERQVSVSCGPDRKDSNAVDISSCDQNSPQSTSEPAESQGQLKRSFNTFNHEFPVAAADSVASAGLESCPSSSKPLRDRSGPVFPSFIKESMVKPTSDLDSISAMYAQVSQHCQLDSADYVNLSDQLFSENDEPRLVIDTDPSNCCREEGLEDDKKSPEDSTELGQPLCLVMHSRNNSDTERNLDSISARGDTDLMKNIKASLTSDNVYHKNYNQEVEQGGGEKQTRALISKHFSKDVDFGTDHKTLAADMQNALDLTMNRTVDREKLVMKISLKNSGTGIAPPAVGSHRRKRKRKRRRSVHVDPAADEPFVEIDNPEDGHGFYSSNDFPDGLSGTEQHAHGIGRNLKQLAETCMSTEEITDPVQSVLEDKQAAEVDRLHRKANDRVSKPIEQEVAKSASRRSLSNRHSSCVKMVENNTFEASIMNQQCVETDAQIPQARVIALRERHIMSSLPPKKRKFRRSPRASREEKVHATVNRETSFTSPVETSTFKTQGSPSSKHGRKEWILPKPSNCIETRNKAKVVNNTVTTELRNMGRTRSRSSVSQALNMCNISESFTSKNNSQRPHLNTFGTVSSDSADQCSFQQCLPDQDSSRHACPMSSCGTTFSRKWNLDAHISKVHTKNSFISCSVGDCNLKFTCRKELRQHVTMDHKGKVRKYKCNWPDCNKSFFACTHLRIHVLTHTGEKPVACEVCDYRCRQRTALIWHMRKHGVFHKGGKSQE